jgi:tetratricopeptide (TPR) repeat protein
MLKTPLITAALLLTCLLAGTVRADNITYIERAGGKVAIKMEDGVSVKSWSASRVEFENRDKKTVSVNTGDVLSLDRLGGTMGKDLQRALDMIGANPQGAIEALAAVASGGSALDKEEATYIRAQLLENESAATGRTGPAINAYKDYVKNWKAGYFARDVYPRLAHMQPENDARATLNSMIRADKSLERLGNQLLGQLEARAGKFPAAISAFKAAQAAARNDKDKNNEALAKAWEGMCTVADGKTAAGRALLEQVTEDESLDDPDSTDDELALAVAYPALGDAHFAGGAYQKAYDAYIKGAYYAWWTGGDREGHCLGRAFLCAKRLESTGERWKKRREKLRSALALGFPRVLQEVEKE